MAWKLIEYVHLPFVVIVPLIRNASGEIISINSRISSASVQSTSTFMTKSILLHLRGPIPLVAGGSLAISAACHLAGEEREREKEG